VSLVRFKAQNHPQQTIKPAVDDRGTAPDDYARFDELYGPFTLDVAASPRNAKCDKFFTVDEDGLQQSWKGERVWCNPPYSGIGKWVNKAWREWHETRGVVMLLPANRCEQVWWQEQVEPYRDSPGTSPLKVVFLPGRMRFIMPGQESVGPNQRPPFGCCLLIWRAP